MDSIDRRIFFKQKEIQKKKKEIEDLKQDILYLKVLKSEMRVPEPIQEEEYFVVPKSILESYFESMF